MLKEAAEKFFRFKGHRFPFIGFGVLVFECDLSILIGQYPVIGDSNLENIPGQVLQYLFPSRIRCRKGLSWGVCFFEGFFV